jgi:hypothetical protein
VYDIIYNVIIIKLNYGWLYIYFEHKYLKRKGKEKKEKIHVMNLFAFIIVFYRK